MMSMIQTALQDEEAQSIAPARYRNHGKPFRLFILSARKCASIRFLHLPGVYQPRKKPRGTARIAPNRRSGRGTNPDAAEEEDAAAVEDV
jgi:hypothetical protein